MPHTTTTIVTAALAGTGGLMALLPLPEAMAQERITLETIGAVRMARFSEPRDVNPEPRPARAAPARDPAAERSAKAR